MDYSTINRKTQSKRKEILKQHNNKCDFCKLDTNLEIHHPHYDYFDIDILRVLCRKCHRALHNTLPKLTKGVFIIHNIDPKLWRQFVGLAKIKDMKAGKLLNELIAVFLEKQKVIDNSPK